MLPSPEKSRPAANGAAASKAGNLELGASIRDAADAADKQRRERLARDLTRVPDRLARRHPGAAALARHWARGGGDR